MIKIPIVVTYIVNSISLTLISQVCCAALAAAEADPAILYSAYGVPQASAYNNYRGLVQPQAWTADTALRAPSVRGYTAQPFGYTRVGVH